MNDDLGKRMKEFYEQRSQTHLPRRTYTLMRLDGKAFHSYTKRFKRPYDLELMKVMDETTIELCKSIQGAKMAFTQSDEISILITDFDDMKTDAWFDGNVQKMVSVSASIATAAFNAEMLSLTCDKAIQGDKDAKIDLSAFNANCMKLAHFDSRVWTMPNPMEVFNYFVWRQQDATRNSIQMGAQSMYSHKELHKKDSSQLQEMMFRKGTNWNDYPVGFKRGRMILKEKVERKIVVDMETGGLDGKPEIHINSEEYVDRNRWGVFEPPVFTQDVTFLMNRILKVK